MKKLNVSTALCLLTLSAASYAAGFEPNVPASSDYSLPKQAFFIGLGGSYNSLKVDEKYNLNGDFNVFSSSDPEVLATGNAGGIPTPFHDTKSTFAPSAQIGYFRQISNSDYLGGIKFFYQYLGTTLTDDSINTQSGTLTTTPSGGSSVFTGNVSADSAQTTVRHELVLMPFIGHTFKNKSYFYLGAGPAVFDTESRLYDVKASTNTNGQILSPISSSSNFSSTKWMWGGAAQVGMTYYVDPSWSLDFNYTFAKTGNYKTNFSAPFTSASGDFNSSGTLNASTTQKLTEQAFMITINKSFSI